MEKERVKEAPLVTTVRTIGLLLSSPMSMYTEVGWRLGGGQVTKYVLIFTVRSSESSTDGGYRRAPADDELIILTLIVGGLRLAEHHVLHVQSGVTTDSLRKGENIV